VKLLRLLALEEYCEKSSITSGEVQAAEEAETKAKAEKAKSRGPIVTRDYERAGDIRGEKALIEKNNDREGR